MKTTINPTDRIGRNGLKILAMILDGQQRGKCPSLMDIKKALGFVSTNGVMAHLKRFRRQGLITWEPFSGRTLRPTCRFIHLERTES